MRRIAFAALLFASACASAEPIAPPIPAPPAGLTPSVAEIVSASPADAWRALDPENTIYMDFPLKTGKIGRVVIEMAPAFSPNHVANVKALSREGFFANGAVTRLQDNFVAQWAQAAEPPRPPKTGAAKLDAEFLRPVDASLPFTILPDPDTYGVEVGFTNSMPAARSGGSTWLVHCYGMVGVGREEDVNSGGGTELYAIIGHAPRALDRQLTMLGRVVQGMDILASLPRGTGAAGFYETPAEYARYADMKIAADVPEAQRTNLEVMRTDSETFATLVNARRWRKDGFYTNPPGRIDLCSVPIPSREMKAR